MGELYARSYLKNNVSVPVNIKNFILDVIDNNRNLIVQEPDFDTFDKLNYIKENINEFVSGRYNLYMYSTNVGVGKSVMAVYIAYYYTIAKEGNYLFVNVPELLDLAKRSLSDDKAKLEYQSLRDKIAAVDIVIWDDIAVKGLTEYENNLMYILVNNRCKTNICTSNIPDTILDKVVDKRIADRLTNGTNLEFRGNSFRSRDFLKGIK